MESAASVLLNMHLQDQRWATFVSRFRSGEWRTPIFYDMVMTDLGSSERIGNATVVDVGCGKGFDCDPTYQRRLGQAAAMFIGIEPIKRSSHSQD